MLTGAQLVLPVRDSKCAKIRAEAGISINKGPMMKGSETAVLVDMPRTLGGWIRANEHALISPRASRLSDDTMNALHGWDESKEALLGGDTP